MNATAVAKIEPVESKVRSPAWIPYLWLCQELFFITRCPEGKLNIRNELPIPRAKTSELDSYEKVTNSCISTANGVLFRPVGSDELTR